MSKRKIFIKALVNQTDLEYNNVKYADPFILGQELNYYLNNKVTQPVYIREDKPNSIINYIKYKL